MGMIKRLYISTVGLAFLIVIAIKTIAFTPSVSFDSNFDITCFFSDLEYTIVDEPSDIFELSEDEHELKAYFGILFHNPFNIKRNKEFNDEYRYCQLYFSQLILFVTDKSPPLIHSTGSI